MSRMSESMHTGGRVHGQVRRRVTVGLAGPKGLGLAGRVLVAVSRHFPLGPTLTRTHSSCHHTGV